VGTLNQKIRELRNGIEAKVVEKDSLLSRINKLTGDDRLQAVAKWNDLSFECQKSRHDLALLEKQKATV
jgi:cell division protein FtsL